MDDLSVPEVRRLVDAANALQRQGDASGGAAESDARGAEQGLDDLFRTSHTLAVYGTLAPVWSGSFQRSPDSPRSPYESATTHASPPREVAAAIAPAARHTKSPECAPTISSFLPPLPASLICPHLPSCPSLEFLEHRSHVIMPLCTEVHGREILGSSLTSAV